MSEKVGVDLSLVIPLFNEAGSLESLHGEIVSALSGTSFHYEIILIDDGSTDGSWSQVEELARRDSRVRGLRFRRNFGKSAALQAGFTSARGAFVVTLDADLQDDPCEITRLLARLGDGFDVVSGWKKVRNDPWHKVLPSRCFNAWVNVLTGISLHDVNCGLKGYRREVLGEIRLYGELHRFTPVLAAARGFRISELEVNHRPRTHGYSKYGWRRFVSGSIDLLTVKFITSFRDRPQHLLGMIGAGAFTIGSLGMCYLAIVWTLNLFGASLGPIGNRPLLIFSATACLAGLQIFSLGLIGELINFRLHEDTKVYSIADEIPAGADSRPSNEGTGGLR